MDGEGLNKLGLSWAKLRLVGWWRVVIIKLKANLIGTGLPTGTLLGNMEISSKQGQGTCTWIKYKV